MSCTIPSIYSDDYTNYDIGVITPIENVPSILEKGLLSHKRSRKHLKRDVSNQSVQGLREKVIRNPEREAAKKKPLKLHQYVNLYLRPHNGMMCVKRDIASTLCVLRIDSRVLCRPEVLVSTQNAARNAARFFSPRSKQSLSPQSSKMLRDRAAYINKEFSATKEMKKKRTGVLQAEALVPYELHPSYIRGAYVANAAGHAALISLLGKNPTIPINIYPSLFVQDQYLHRQSGELRCSYILKDPPRSSLHNTQYPNLVEDLPESSDEGSEETTVDMFKPHLKVKTTYSKKRKVLQKEDSPKKRKPEAPDATPSFSAPTDGGKTPLAESNRMSVNPKVKRALLRDFSTASTSAKTSQDS